MNSAQIRQRDLAVLAHPEASIALKGAAAFNLLSCAASLEELDGLAEHLQKAGINRQTCRERYTARLSELATPSAEAAPSVTPEGVSGTPASAEVVELSEHRPTHQPRPGGKRARKLQRQAAAG